MYRKGYASTICGALGGIMREKDEFQATGCDTGVYTSNATRSESHKSFPGYARKQMILLKIISYPPYQSYYVLHDNIHRAYINIYALRIHVDGGDLISQAARQSHEQQITHPYAREKYIGHNFA